LAEKDYFLYSAWTLDQRLHHLANAIAWKLIFFEIIQNKRKLNDVYKAMQEENP